MATFRGFVDDAGAFAIDDRKGMLAYVQKFKGHEVAVSIKKWPRPQGTQSLRYLRGVVIPDIAEACGYTDPDDYESVYEGLMWKFFRLTDGPFGEPRRQSCSKKTMTREEISNVIDTLIQYAETSIPGCKVRRPEDADLDRVADQDWQP